MRRIRVYGVTNTLGTLDLRLHKCLQAKHLLIPVVPLQRHLAAEIEEEYASRTETGETTSQHSTSDLHALALRLVPFLLSHNGEADAVDLLLELESISSIIPFVDENTYTRVCLYMTSCVNLLVPPDDREFLRCAREIYRKFERYSQAIVCSLRLNDAALVKEDFLTPKNP